MENWQAGISFQTLTEAMNRLIPVALLCIVLIGCRSDLIGQQRSFEPVLKMESVDSPCVDKEMELGGEFLVETRFPGGLCAWRQFLRQNFTYPPEALDAEIVGTVVVQFVINTNGDVYLVKAVSGPEMLKQSAEELIRKSPKWKPGYDQGRPVGAVKKQPIYFGFVYE